jgi:hypothetical protein
MAKRSAHQQRIIRNYYEHRDTIMLQKLGEMVTELYLAEGKKRDKLWERAAAALRNLGVPDKQVEQLVTSDNPALLAERLKQMLGQGS